MKQRVFSIKRRTDESTEKSFLKTSVATAVYFFNGIAEMWRLICTGFSIVRPISLATNGKAVGKLSDSWALFLFGAFANTSALALYLVAVGQIQKLIPDLDQISSTRGTLTPEYFVAEFKQLLNWYSDSSPMLAVSFLFIVIVVAGTVFASVCWFPLRAFYRTEFRAVLLTTGAALVIQACCVAAAAVIVIVSPHSLRIIVFGTAFRITVEDAYLLATVAPALWLIAKILRGYRSHDRKNLEMHLVFAAVVALIPVHVCLYASNHIPLPPKTLSLRILPACKKNDPITCDALIQSKFDYPIQIEWIYFKIAYRSIKGIKTDPIPIAFRAEATNRSDLNLLASTKPTAMQLTAAQDGPHPLSAACSSILPYVKELQTAGKSNIHGNLRLEAPTATIVTWKGRPDWKLSVSIEHEDSETLTEWIISTCTTLHLTAPPTRP